MVFLKVRLMRWDCMVSYHSLTPLIIQPHCQWGSSIPSSEANMVFSILTSQYWELIEFQLLIKDKKEGLGQSEPLLDLNMDWCDFLISVFARLTQFWSSGLSDRPLQAGDWIAWFKRPSESPPSSGWFGGRIRDESSSGQNRQLLTVHLPYVDTHSLPLCIKYFYASM